MLKLLSDFHKNPSDASRLIFTSASFPMALNTDTGTINSSLVESTLGRFGFIIRGSTTFKSP